MSLPRSARLAAAFGVLLAVTFAASSPAADPVPKWDPVRTTAPEDLAELKALQASVNAVADKCMPTTVALLYGQAAGSGVIVSEDGLVLTAAHVIRDYDVPKKGAREGKELPYTSGKRLTIMLQDGTKVEGKTLGIHGDIINGMDSGMVQITTKGPNNGKWPFSPIAKAADVQKGQWVVSLGHPNGPKNERPPVARLGRIQKGDKNLLRTDCTIVGGDSGGPLFDLNGKVIGIHSRIVFPFSLAQNIHVPIDHFHKDWDKLLAGEWVDKPVVAKTSGAYFGVVFPEDDEEDAWLKEVLDGPAANGGLQPGDTITKFNDTVVKSVKAFRKLMADAKPNDKVKITVRRGVTVMSVNVTLAKQ